MRASELFRVKMRTVKKRSDSLSLSDGYTAEDFGQLLPYFFEHHDRYLSRYQINGKRRKGTRSFVLYANSPLPSVEERLAFMLSYLKLNPLQEQHADLFDMQQKQCYEFVHGLKTILDQALDLVRDYLLKTTAGFQDKLAELSTAPRQPDSPATSIHLLDECYRKGHSRSAGRPKSAGLL